MSVLNKTLKGLEQRQSKVNILTEQEQTVTVAPVLDLSEKIHKLILPLLVFIAFCLISYVIYKKSIFQQYVTDADVFSEKIVTVRKVSNDSSNQSLQHLQQESQLLPKKAEDEVVSQIVHTHDAHYDKNTTEAVQPQAEDESIFFKVENEAPRNEVVKQQEKKIVTEPSEHSMKQITQLSAEQKAKEYFQAGKKAFRFGLVSEAVVELQNCITILPEHIACRSLLAAAYYGRKETVKASDILEQGLNLEPSSMEWRILLAKIYADNKQYQEVLSVLSQQFESQGDNDFWILKGLAAQQLSQHAVALRSFKKLTLAEPQQGKWWLAMGRSAEHLKHWQNAMQYYTTATQVGNLSPASQRYAVERLLFIRGRLNAS
ncbi:tetratricopeptide repeat protein [Pseudoalteromonas sp.]|uniref:tetratricopeptide repeat protein n=1 Tax=Pseudoalteromonas sp. TaxID=53249 RepID=UPI00356828F9